MDTIGAEESLEQNAKFSAAFDPSSVKVIVRLDPGFVLEDWPAIEKISQKQLSDGRIHWRMDLCALPLLTSRLIGLLIGLNAILDLRGGSLELLVQRGSSNANALRQTRLNQILTVTEM